MTSATSQTAATIDPTDHLKAGRLGAILAVLPFPLWLICFVLLYGSLGPKSANDPSLDEQHAQYLAAGPAIWIFGVVAIAAAVLLGLAPAVIARALGRGPLPGIIVGVGAVTMAVSLWNTLGFLAFLAVGPGALPGWMLAADAALNGIAWSLAALAVPLLGLALRRARILPRAGLVVAIIGAVLLAAILAFQFWQPMTPAILLFVLGIALLRRTK